MSTRFLFLVNGLGLGNSTRCHALIQHLTKFGAECLVVTTGNGAWYFLDRSDVSAVHEIDSFFYGSKAGKISIVSTFGSAFTFARIQMRNAARIEEILQTTKPDMAVLDSMYVMKPFRRHAIPVAALNNSDVVYRARRFFGGMPRSVRAQFYAVECADYMWHQRFPDIVISPTLVPDLGATTGKVHSVTPIVRKECLPMGNDSEVTKIIIMLSGSAFGSQVRFTDIPPRCRIEVIGRQAPEGMKVPDGVRFLGRVRDTLSHMQSADLVVVNGGFSAVSEAYALGVPVVVVPVPNHAEQWFNGKMIEHLGVGMIGNEDTIEEDIIGALENLDTYRAAYGEVLLPVDGAQRAAEILLDQVS